MKGKRSVASALLGGGPAPRREIRTIVFACDAGMGSSAMGASVLRKKIHAAGHGEVSVVNKAIASLDRHLRPGGHPSGPHRSGPRATPSAIHVSVDNFMASPRYDEIVELIEAVQREGRADPGRLPGGRGGGEPDVLLSVGSIVLGGSAQDRDAAIEEAGQLLVDSPRRRRGVRHFHARAGAVGLDVHGQRPGDPARHQRGQGLDPADGDLVRALRPAPGLERQAGRVRDRYCRRLGDDHLALLSRIAEIFVDADRVSELRAARTPDEVLSVLQGVRV